jgi:hypothetical protein
MNRKSFILLLPLLACSTQVIKRAEFFALSLLPSVAYLQQYPPQRPQQKRLTLAQVEAAVEKDGCFEFKESGAFPASTVCKYDFKLSSKTVPMVWVIRRSSTQWWIFSREKFVDGLASHCAGQRRLASRVEGVLSLPSDLPSYFFA